MNLKLLAIVLLIPLTTFASSDNIKIIYDSETQNLIKKIVGPIFKVARVKKGEIYIIDNLAPNAFTMGGETVYIHTGLITKFNDPNILRGVLAHEVGHITSRHVNRMQLKAIDQQKLSATSLILGLAGAVLTGNPALAIQGGMVGSHVAERNMLKFSRENETAADIKANEYLRKSGYNSEGLITLLKHFKSQQHIPNEFRYDLTHPVSNERITLIKNNPSNFQSFIEDNKIKQEYEMVSAKLAAYSGIKYDDKKYSPKANKYAAAIIAMNKADKKTALNNINSLINEDPHNPYLHQLKAEILTRFGDIAAFNSYKDALSQLNDEIIKVEYAIARIILNKNSSSIKEAIAVLEMSSPQLLYNNTVLDYLAIGYDKINNRNYSIYYRALQQKNLGNKATAKRLARQAKTNLPQNSPLYIKIDDIIRTNE